MMSVKLINYSQSPDGMNLLEQVAFAARVSNPANQNNTETADKLVRYLIKNQHWSPLEMVSVCLEIDTTRDIARQILRHRSFSFQEFSQRYADASQLGFVTREARLQDTKNRQNSIETDNHALAAWWENYQNEVIKKCSDAYQFALEKGIAKEQARAVLPEGITKSRMYMNGTLRSWVHYIQLRSANGTQKEHQQIAIDCAAAIEPIFPMIKEFINGQSH
jgi:thymidylate synthase (FAD)